MLNVVQYAFSVLILLSHFEFTNDLFDFREEKIMQVLGMSIRGFLQSRGFYSIRMMMTFLTT